MVDDSTDPVIPNNIVEAGNLAMVEITNYVYDDRLVADGGCPPDGCKGALTRVSFAKLVAHKLTLHMTHFECGQLQTLLLPQLCPI